MSWSQSYSYTLVIGLDRFGAAVFFNQPDLTISSLCWIVRTNAPTLPLLKLSTWQLLTLRWIGSGLEWLQPGHCANARASDMAASQRAADLLGAHYVA